MAIPSGPNPSGNAMVAGKATPPACSVGAAPAAEAGTATTASMTRNKRKARITRPHDAAGAEPAQSLSASAEWSSRSTRDDRASPCGVGADEAVEVGVGHLGHAGRKLDLDAGDARFGRGDPARFVGEQLDGGGVVPPHVVDQAVDAIAGRNLAQRAEIGRAACRE